MAWNDPDLGITWPNLEGSYPGNASAEGYKVDGVDLILSDKSRHWLGL